MSALLLWGRGIWAKPAIGVTEVEEKAQDLVVLAGMYARIRPNDSVAIGSEPAAFLIWVRSRFLCGIKRGWVMSVSVSLGFYFIAVTFFFVKKTDLPLE